MVVPAPIPLHNIIGAREILAAEIVENLAFAPEQFKAISRAC